MRCAVVTAARATRNADDDGDGEDGGASGARDGSGARSGSGARGGEVATGEAAAGGASLPRPLLRSAVELYLDLHAHPELSGQEHRTADRLAARLTGHGCTVTRSVGGGHGLVGVLRNGPGPTVLLRTELDALPVTEATGLPYASTVPGVMHACGHDLHIAAVAGAVAHLAATRDTWRGTVLVVGQPEEETLRGARSMLAEGRLYERFGVPDAVLAQHAAPLPAGTLAHAPAGGPPLMAGSVAVEAVLHGRGGHAATPHLNLDPVLMAAATVLRLRTVVAEATAPAEQAVLTVGSVRAGERGNVTPDHAELSLTIRAFTEEALDRLTAAAERVVRAEAAASGAPRTPEFTVTARSPVLRPDPALTARVRGAHEALLGPGRVLDLAGSAATEDFPHFASGGRGGLGAPGGPGASAGPGGSGAVPVAYWMLGTTGAGPWRAARAGGAPVPPNHAPGFAPDVRAALPVGITALATAARHVLAPGPAGAREAAS
ncbi:amidohydrolase [Streptomyces sp. SID14515]|uniref:amidohydrolase n=1 Tax=Streptomyces sp. SID14515 TaxID=2706074 RepID=UPI0013CC6F1F|nr:amidohydrolase [Streptomyces sp. SID14515]NEB38972.1 amidohydrolase [Streptomyces sp. SID14515]